MKNRSYSSYRNSEMARVAPKRHIFRTLINNKLKRHRTDTGLVEDRTNSTTVVRMIVGLLLIHLIVIGGVILRGKIKSADSGAIAAPTITAPPAMEAKPVQNDVLPQPVEGPVANPVREAVPHITQTPADADATAAPAVAEPELVTPVLADDTAEVAEPTTPAEANTATPEEPTYTRHLVSSGETLYGIASKHHTSVEAIRKANPQLRNNNIISGTYLNIPVQPTSEAGRKIAADRAAEAATEAAKMYTIRRGDTLRRIARRHNTTVSELMKLNNIPKGKEGNIRVGDTIRIAQ